MITEQHFHEAEYEAAYLLHFGVIDRPQSPRYNDFFSPMMNAVTFFIRPPETSKAKWTCAACEKKRGRQWFWTMIVPFRASQNLNDIGFGLHMGGLLPSFTPVCQDHCLSMWPDKNDEPEPAKP